MKKIFTLAFICGSLMYGGFAVDAKKTTEKQKRGLPQLPPSVRMPMDTQS